MDTTFVIDGLDAGIVRLESDDGRIWHLPAALLPDAAREGDVVAFTRFARADAQAVAWLLEVDHAATTARREALRRLRNTLPEGPTGDITL